MFEQTFKNYEFIIDEAHRWSSWAAPKKADGTLDRDHVLIGDDLIDYVNRKLFPYLQGFKQRATSPDTIEYKIGKFLARLRIGFKAATVCGMRSTNRGFDLC